jgi:dephospho-CoA kinase
VQPPPDTKRDQPVASPGGSAPITNPDQPVASPGGSAPITNPHQPVASPGGSAPVFVGLTGAVAAGKSEALAAFERLGAATLSSDAVTHELLGYPEVRDRLVERWGEEVTRDGEVDRARIGAIVFGRPEELAWLESLLHPLVGRRVAAWRGSLPPETELAVVEVPLLFETGMEAVFDATVCVVADDEIREARAGERGTELLQSRGERQLSQEEKAARATHVVRNDGSLADLEREVARLLPELVTLARGAG